MGHELVLVLQYWIKNRMILYYDKLGFSDID